MHLQELLALVGLGAIDISGIERHGVLVGFPGGGGNKRETQVGIEAVGEEDDDPYS